MNIKVIHYIPTIDKNSGGIGSYIQLLSKELGKLADLHIITHKSDYMLNIENATIHFIEGNLLHFFKMRSQFFELLNIINPNIVHINCCWYPQCSLVQKWSQEKGYKTILSPHGMLEPWVLEKNHWLKKVPALLLYQKKAIKQAEILIATANTEKQNLINLGYNNNVCIIPNGIIIDGINSKNTWDKKKIILFLALLRPNKGAHILIEAIALLKNSLIDWRVIIAGKGDKDYTKYLNKLIQKHKLEKIVSLPGPIFGNEKWDMFRNSDIFVLPTLHENFGIVIAESLLCGTPVITCQGAPWEGLIKNKCGWWIERTPESIANTIKKAINLNENELKSMGIRGREYIIKNFSSNLIAKQMLNMYMQVIYKS